MSAQNTSIYLDFAAATPMDNRVVAAMQPYVADSFYNPSAVYGAARDVRAALEDARAKIAFWLGARPSEVIFTAGATEANNLAINGVLQQYEDGNCVVGAIEHDSVLEPAQTFKVRQAPVDTKGRINTIALFERIDDKTVLVSIGYVNNEIGAIQPLIDITRKITEIRTQRKEQGNTRPLLFHTDAAQAAQYLDLHVDRLGVDLMSINGGKIYGPKQSGILYVRGGTIVKPQVYGGGQEYGMRSGTENVSGCIGLATALEITQKMRVDEAKRVEILRNEMLENLQHTFADIELNGAKNHRVANNISITFAGMDGERLLMMLDEKGVQCSTGAACSAQKDDSSHVIKALGKTEEEARGTLRFTLGRSTTKADCDEAVVKLRSVIEEYKAL